MNMQTGMVVVLEKGFESSMQFMEQVRLTGIEHNLEGWWWCSDKGLIRDPSESNEMLVKAQTMYDALRGKPIYVNGVRIFQAHSRSDIMKMLDVCQHDVLNLPEPKTSVAAIDLNDPEGGGLLSEDMEKTTEFPEIRLGGHTVEEVFSFDNKQTHTTFEESNKGFWGNCSPTTQEVDKEIQQRAVVVNGKATVALKGDANPPHLNSEAVTLHRKLDIFGLGEDKPNKPSEDKITMPEDYFGIKLLIAAILVIAAIFIFSK